jgi:molybdate transport system substrate-binding protein
MRLHQSALAAFLLSAGIFPAQSAEVKLLAGANMQGVLTTTTSAFEKESGNKLNITYDTSGGAEKRYQAGERFDVVIIGRAVLDKLATAGTIKGTIKNVANSPIGIIIKKGAPKLQLASNDEVKKALLSAKSVVYTDPEKGGLSAVFFQQYLEKNGIAEQIRSKAKLVPPPGINVAKAVASGEGEIGINQKAEVQGEPGIELVTGQLAPEINPKFLVAVTSESSDPAAATFMSFLSSATFRSSLENAGMEPQ